MRVVVRQHVTDDAHALVETCIGAVSAVVHGIQDAAVNRLEAVSHVRKGAAHNDRHGVIKVRPLHFHFEVDLINPSVRSG